MHEGKNIDEYEFYPFDIDENNNLFFDLNKFNDGVLYLIRNRDSTAARQLILIGEQIFDDTVRFLENYKRIVRLIGDSFPDTGMEILLHNLTNPSKALYHIKNNVTGRNIEAPATKLVHDLKTRGLQNKDKLNYEFKYWFQEV